MLPLPKQDIKEAARWYNTRQKGLGNRFTQQVRKKSNLLKDHPFSSVTKYHEVKPAVLDVFPFMAHYVVDETQKLIIVTAVLHTSRNPDGWKKDRDGANSDD
jgi:hypothetical protein